ncbi:hypothetical protein PGT21_022620 [Puccinia graminis f. sp. tritici]|uniref:Uncharacterized protein n=1 Tax=Puccinia graminis f. sp. tritici TaxID=56615 RepID=A0A5B0PUQ8_PUCGR|nr:hypothetical protein PGT21_022620 [Puccinia graminis f. sp. tritici]
MSLGYDAHLRLTAQNLLATLVLLKATFLTLHSHYSQTLTTLTHSNSPSLNTSR